MSVDAVSLMQNRVEGKIAKGQTTNFQHSLVPDLGFEILLDDL